MLGSGRNVNLLVLDTEVYSNTGGQASKATPLGAVAKFATAGKPTGKKDLGAIARSYGNVYVAQVAIGGSDIQTVKALLEADAWDGPSLVIAYSTCIAHGIDMSTSMTHQKDAVRSGYWPLYRYRPSPTTHQHPFQLDSSAPTVPFVTSPCNEARYAMLARTDPERSAELLRSRRPTSTSAGTTTSSWPTSNDRSPTTDLRPMSSRRSGHDRPHHEVPRLRLRSPIVASPGPITGHLDRLVELDEAGVGAVVLPSLFQEQIEHEERDRPALLDPAPQLRRSRSFFPGDGYDTGTRSTATCA